jgi:hypothetical protein
VPRWPGLMPGCLDAAGWKRLTGGAQQIARPPGKHTHALGSAHVHTFSIRIAPAPVARRASWTNSATSAPSAMRSARNASRDHRRSIATSRRRSSSESSSRDRWTTAGGAIPVRYHLIKCLLVRKSLVCTREDMLDAFNDFSGVGRAVGVGQAEDLAHVSLH